MAVFAAAWQWRVINAMWRGSAMTWRDSVKPSAAGVVNANLLTNQNAYTLTLLVLPVA